MDEKKVEKKWYEMLTPEEILEYLDLVNRRLEICMSGVNWKPEYAQELEEIDKRISVLRVKVDAVHAAKEQQTEFEKNKVHVNVALPEEMLQKIRELRAWWVDLIGIEDKDLAAPLPDDMLLLMALHEWIDFKWDSLMLEDPGRQKLKEEVRQAYLNGGRTPYLFDDDGNEYYTTRDGKRHYTRNEG